MTLIYVYVRERLTCLFVQERKLLWKLDLTLIPWVCFI